jgi:hypothetical protein
MAFAIGSCFFDRALVARNRVFATDFVTTRRFGKKPGFFDCAVSWCVAIGYL